MPNGRLAPGEAQPLIKPDQPPAFKRVNRNPELLSKFRLANVLLLVKATALPVLTLLMSPDCVLLPELAIVTSWLLEEAVLLLIKIGGVPDDEFVENKRGGGKIKLLELPGKILISPIKTLDEIKLPLTTFTRLAEAVAPPVLIVLLAALVVLPPVFAFT